MLFQSVTSWMYGYPATLTAIRVEGQASDGTARPGADIHAIVEFDATEAGCASDGYCNPGADIEWWVNGTKIEQSVGSGWNEVLNGYRVASPRLTAPSSGTMEISARNSKSVATFPIIRVSSTDPSAGSISISSVSCANQEDNPSGQSIPNCACGGSNLTLYFTATVLSAGNGMAYYDVLVNGSVVSQNNVFSTRWSSRGSITIPCPAVGSQITIRGKGESGDSITLYSTGATTGSCQKNINCFYPDYCDGDSCTNGNAYTCQTGVNCNPPNYCAGNTCTTPGVTGCQMGVNCSSPNYCSNNQCTTSGTNKPTTCVGMNRNGSIDPTCALQKGNEMYLYGGLAVAAIAAYILLKKRK